MTDIAEFAERIAREAGEMIRHEREQNTLRTDYKQQTELVTHADVMADEFITGAIRKAFPEHRILSEETMPDLSQAENLDTPLWVVDPIDGTVNYAYGHPQVAVSIAYAEQGRVQVGVVHAPPGAAAPPSMATAFATAVQRSHARPCLPPDFRIPKTTWPPCYGGWM